MRTPETHPLTWRLRDDKQDHRKDKAQQDDVFFRLDNTFGVPRAVVIAEDGLRTRRDAAERHGDDQHKAL